MTCLRNAPRARSTSVIAAVILILAVAAVAVAQSSGVSFREPVADDRISSASLHEPVLPEPALPVVVSQWLPEELDGTLPARTRDYQQDGGRQGDGRRPATLPEPRLPLLPVPSPPPALGTWTPHDPASPILDRQVIAFYGNPRSRLMGILGEEPIEQVARRLRQLAAEYDALNGSLGVLPAFHLIYGTVFTDAEIGVLDDAMVRDYINFAYDAGFIVFLDHQIGRYTVEQAITAMLPYLRYPNVHLAIDPEWATLRPGREIGRVTAQQINRAQELIQAYLIEHDIPGKKLLVVHQFNYHMIADRESVLADFPRVELIHNADGFGAPAEKIETWRLNVLASNMPHKGFKLFFPKDWRRAGFDVPLMSPQEVLSLEPVPVYIQYQ